MIESLPGFTNLPPELQSAILAGAYGLAAIFAIAAARFAVGLATNVRNAMEGRLRGLSVASLVLSVAMFLAVLLTVHGVVAPIMEAMPR